MYGYQQIAGQCVDCMTFEEAIDVAVIWSNTGGQRYKVEGEHIQHFNGVNVSRERIYCWQVHPTKELSKHGNQRTKGNTRCN